ncbi:G-coupled receptor -like protein [Brachionus plicatilis]|uniref:G-coupled receptor-like protein n=1 Tax=Brachionus plicatilis TaxID=10195 RepID=A0A3M7S111_BRAPC|nr:G-coupled receptor -like protein [Brachionus plicatilis]
MVEFRYIWTPILVVTGTILNLLTIMVFCRRKMRKYCVSLSMIALAISDTSVLTMPLLLSWLDEVFFHFYFVNNTLWCNLHGYADLISSSNSSWIIILISLERWYAVCKPWEKQRKFTNKRVLFIISALFLFSLAFFSYFPFSLHLTESTYPDGTMVKECQLSNENIYYIFGFISVVIVYILPFFVLFYLNLMIVFKLRLRPFTARSISTKREKSTLKKITEISEHSLSQTDASSPGQLNPSSSLQNQSKNDRNLSITLVTVAFTFMILTFPFQVYWFYENIYLNFNFEILSNFSSDSSVFIQRPPDTESEERPYLKYFKNMTFLLKNMNYLINFFLYSALSKLFREEFLAMISKNKCLNFYKKIFCFKKLDGERESSTNGSSLAEVSFSLEAFKKIKKGELSKSRKLFQIRVEPSNLVEFFRSKKTPKTTSLVDTKMFRSHSTQTVSTTIKEYKKSKLMVKNQNLIENKSIELDGFPSGVIEIQSNSFV